MNKKDALALLGQAHGVMQDHPSNFKPEMVEAHGIGLMALGESVQNEDTYHRYNVKAIIEALRCSSSSEVDCKHEECPYWTKCTEDDVEAFLKEHPDANIPDDFFAGCDCDRICMDAAKVLEKVFKGNLDVGK